MTTDEQGWCGVTLTADKISTRSRCPNNGLIVWAVIAIGCTHSNCITANSSKAKVIVHERSSAITNLISL